MNDVTLVIQGPISKRLSNGLAKGIRHIETYCKFGRVIVSTWDSHGIKPSKKFLAKHNITLIEANPDDYKHMYNSYNINYQVASTLNGLKKVTTKYAIKLRSDEYYSDLSKFIKKIKDNPEKIVANNVFFREDSYEAFHPSDHVIGGTTENMLGMFNYAFVMCQREFGKAVLTSDYFNIPRQEWKDHHTDVGEFVKRGEICPEVFLCFSYLLSKGVKLDLSKSKEIMKKHFDVVPVADMGKCVCKAGINSSRQEFQWGGKVINSMEEL